MVGIDVFLVNNPHLFAAVPQDVHNYRNSLHALPLHHATLKMMAACLSHFLRWGILLSPRKEK